MCVCVCAHFHHKNGHFSLELVRICSDWYSVQQNVRELNDEGIKGARKKERGREREREGERGRGKEGGEEKSSEEEMGQKKGARNRGGSRKNV